MKASEFCYWLQGYIEIGHDQMHQTGLNHDQMEVVKRHLALVFKHELDKTHGDEAEQAALNAIHSSQQSGDEIFRC